MSYRYKIATVFLLGFFIDCINIFMSAIALPNIASSFSVSQSMVAWVTNAYILGLILIMPMSLWLATKLGNQKLLCYSMLLFSISICFIGSSESIYSLILAIYSRCSWRFINSSRASSRVCILPEPRTPTHFYINYGNCTDCASFFTCDWWRDY